LGKISVEVAMRQLRLTFYRAANLVTTLTEARRENVHLAVSPLVKGRLILRELGVVSFKRAGGENLLDLLSERNEIHSTLVTTGR
jgi:glyoxylate carboligase